MSTSRYAFHIRLMASLLLSISGLFTTAYAQSSLLAGDIAFTGYNSADHNDFSFVLLANISTGTNIKFTDNGYKIAGTNALGTGEGTLSWTASTALPRFTHVYIKINPDGNAVLSVSAGTIDPGFSNFILSQGGDQVLAYQGTSANPAFISGIHMNSETSTPSTAAGWDNMISSTPFTQTRSDIPPGLTNGTDAIMVVPNPGVSGAEKDKGRYNCTGATGATIAAIRSAINNVSNWDIQDGISYALPPACTFAIGTSLYVNLSSFQVKKENNGAGLYWTTQTEIDNAGFDIERSMDGKVYHAIGTVISKAENGNSKASLAYYFHDTAPFTGMNFYRLAEKDNKGNVVYSDVRKLSFDGKSGFLCYPNPVRSQLFVECNADKNEMINIRMINAMGKVVRTQAIKLQKGFNQMVFNMEGLRQGIYNMAILTDSGAVYNAKITKH